MVNVIEQVTNSCLEWNDKCSKHVRAVGEKVLVNHYSGQLLFYDLLTVYKMFYSENIEQVWVQNTFSV